MWRWPNFSGLTIFEFINHGTVTFFPLLTSLSKFSQFPRQVKHVHFSSILRQRETRKISSIIRVTQRIIWTRSSIFCYWIDMNIYTQSFPVCNSGQHTYVTGLLNFFYVLQDLIDRIDSYFQRIAFQMNLLLIGF